ncbi:ABC transporter ATP-binding protein [Anaerocolumna xylanovorans]|uniref:Putative ABC transport system ATP-binding protein n=1 Tax=Anaerocolumna xylanovorans DSM 12503 TaxID=1121345 RepID=A0A1M7YLR0_9FIRM|nr:ABC transporter ATP-binding protein [Anaerocolumna xylanovorans]SHO53575.1 putative ABC transport system ATP-binding protein [Anaerocolumna xylanovorans DSM 12503]
MSFVEFQGVTKIYKSGDATIKALDNIHFSFEKGSFAVILGPSGSGKSTLLNLLGGMDFASEGSILVNEINITKMDKGQLTLYRRNDIGFVFQFYNILPNLTAYENIDMAYRLSKSSISSEEAIEAVGLKHRMNNFPSQLSGGELQRVSIARALCKNPNIMLCDEPTGALDSETGKMILKILQEMSAKYNTTVIIVTHNAVIADIADTVLRLKDGKVESVVKSDNPLKVEEVEW